MEPLPTPAQVKRDIAAADDCISDEIALRRRFRRRTKRRDPDRQAQIEAHIEASERRSSILRSHLKRSDHHPGRPYTTAHRRWIKSSLRHLREGRRQLKKMLP